LVCALVVMFYGWTVAPSRSDWGNVEARAAYYNLLSDGFRAGQLHLKTAVPAGLAALPDPYDPQANHVYRTRHHLHDTSYYRGRLYIYWGLSPALSLFLPYRLLTGEYLYNKQAVFVFCSAGFLLGAGLLWACWRRYFPDVGPFALTGAVLTLGFASSVPLLLRTPAVCEVAIGCAFMFLMATLAALWCALHEPAAQRRWLAIASVCFGLAVGARPSVLPAAVIFLLPLLQAWRTADAKNRRSQVWRLLVPIALPLLIVGTGLALYNYQRFGSILEFGQRYQLAGDRQDTAPHFRASYLWFNLRAYFLSVATFRPVFPYLNAVALPPPPAGHMAVESAYGVLINTPITLFAAALGLLWARHRRAGCHRLRGFACAVTGLFLCTTGVLAFFYVMVFRYQAEFVPWLALLASIGLLAAEAAARDRPRARAILRAGWLGCLLVTLGFVGLSSTRLLAEQLNIEGVQWVQQGKTAEAVARFESALAIKADLTPAHSNLGILRLNQNQPQAAGRHFSAALAIEPNSLELRHNFGRALAAEGKIAEAAEQFARALALDPRAAVTHFNLATLLARLGRAAEAVKHYEAALDLGLAMPGLRESLEIARQAAGRSDAGRMP
jgi:tetratricopeptide (TPR) repeat protein